MTKNDRSLTIKELLQLFLSKNKERQRALQRKKLIRLTKDFKLQLFRNKLTASTKLMQLIFSKIKLTVDKDKITQMEKFINILRDIARYGRNITLTISTRGLSFWQIKMIQFILDGRRDDLELLMETEKKLMKLAQERNLRKQESKNEIVYDNRDLRTNSRNFLSLDDSHMEIDYDGKQENIKEKIINLRNEIKRKKDEYSKNV